MITTIDNPYNPYTDYVKWRQWDRDNEYFTEEKLARLVGDTDNLTDDEVDKVVIDATNYLIENDPYDVYVFAEE